MAMTWQQHQGHHGEGLVFALACAAGLLASRPHLDIDGVDWSIGFPGPVGKARSPKIDVQVKTWSAPDGADDAFRYRMQVRHFNALAGPGFLVPRYLLLVTTPAEPDEYAVCDAEALSLRHAGYWLSLTDQDALPVNAEEAKTVVVSVPRRNLLTPQSLKALVFGEEAGT
jgi:hypothetical protein